MGYYTQNPTGISTVRISQPSVKGLNDLDVVNSRQEVLDFLSSNGYQTRLGTSDNKISLTGGNGVQSHIRGSDAYILCGQPSLGELFKLVSLFVGQQTLDPDLHFKISADNDAELYRRPIIIHGDDSGFKPTLNLLEKLHEMGTIRQNPFSIIHRTQTTDEVGKILTTQVKAEASIHAGGATQEEIKEAFDRYKKKTFFDYDYAAKGIAEPVYKVVAYMSASKNSDDAYMFGERMAKGGIGVISGAGATGSMHDVVRGVREANGWSYGLNCPHIAAQEGIPSEMLVRLVGDIYERMYQMKQPSNAVMACTGGWGGAGTVQEILAAALFISRNDKMMQNGKNGSRSQKPLVLDNSEGLMEGMQDILEPYNLRPDVHFKIGDTTQECVEVIEKARAGEITFGAGRSSVRAF